MCRSSSEGGRRCPGCNSAAAKSAAAANRKRNRQSKKKIKQHFQSLGMNDTSDMIDDIAPAQIPHLMESLKLGEDILDGEQMPFAGNATAEKRDASDVVQKALAEAAAKNIQLVAEATDMIKEADLDPITEKQLVDAFTDYIYTTGEGIKDIVGDKGELTPEYEKLFEIASRLEDGDYSDKWWSKKLSEASKNAMDRIGEPSHVKKIKENLEEFDLIPTPKRAMSGNKKIVDYYKDNYWNGEGIEAKLNAAINDPSNSSDADALIRKQLFLNSISFGEPKIYKLDNDMYSVNKKNKHYLVYAPNGMTDYESMEVSKPHWGGFREHYATGYPSKFGIEGMSTEDRKKVMPELTEFAIGIRNSKKYGDPISSVINAYIEGAGQLEIDSYVIKDLRIAHSFAHKKTLLHSSGLFTDSEKVTPQKAKQILAGLVPTRKKHDLPEYFNREEMFKETVDKDNVNEEEKNEVNAVGEFLKKDYKMGDTTLIRDYTGSAYSYMADTALGAKDTYSTYGLEEVDRMNTVIKELGEKTVKESRLLYRGVQPPYGTSAYNYAKQFEVGEVVGTSKLTSTSHDPSVPSSFNSNLICVYKTSKGASVQSVSQHYSEREVILPGGEDFVYLGYEENDGKITMFFSDADEIK